MSDRNLFRMPIGFGPSIGPRQGPGGRRFTGEPMRTTLLSIPYLTDPDQLAAVLPVGFRPAAEPIVTVRLQYNLGFPWLAGRSYNYVEVLFRAVFEGANDRVEGDYVAVMWESMADPIYIGREEAGHPKLFADVPDPVSTATGTVGTASWCGFTFAEWELDGLRLGPWPTELEESTPMAPANQGISARPRFNYKYVPSSVRPGEADADYVVMIPGGVYQQKILERWEGTARVHFHPARWEDLPTFCQIVNGLAGLEVRAWCPGSMARIVKYTNDLRDVMVALS